MKRIILLLFIFISITGLAQSWDSLSGAGVNKITVGATCLYNGNLCVGGQFYIAGKKPAKNIALWNDTTWSALGSGVNGWVWNLTVYNGKLIACGDFTLAGGNPANNIAQWDGSSWSALGTGIKYHTSPGGVYALAVYNNNLYVGGRFDSAGNIPANNIAQWDGSSWTTLGSGTNGTIDALAVYNGDLWIGGKFDTADGLPIKMLARWNNTSGWNTMYITYDGEAECFALYKGNLVVAGMLGYGSSEDIMQWDGANWSGLGTGVSEDWHISQPIIYALCSYNNILYTGGFFDTAGGNPANNVAMWDGIKWSAMGSGITGSVNGEGWTVQDYNNRIYVGGPFDTAGGIQAGGIAAWSSPEGIKEIIDKPNITLYPNPNNGAFTLSCHSELVSESHPTIEIYNALGQEVYNGQLAMHNGQCKIDLSTQANGVYLYRIVTASGKPIADGKFVIEK